MLFSAAIALEHDFITREGPAASRIAAARAMADAIATLRLATGTRAIDTESVLRGAEELNALAATLPPVRPAAAFSAPGKP